MAYVINRGSRSRPNYHARLKSAAGAWFGVPTHARQKARAQEIADEMQQRVDRGLSPVAGEDVTPLVGDLLRSWLESLTNRNAKDDRYRANKHLVPAFAQLRMSELASMKRVVAWLDELAARAGAKKLSSASQRQLFNLLSRFFTWAIARGHTEINPCRMVVTKPDGKPERPRAWSGDAELARTIFERAHYPFNLVHLITHESGARPGEACGLRLSDLAWLEAELPEARVLRCRYSRLGPLKEADGITDSLKWLPTTDDLVAHLLAERARRAAEGAGPEQLLLANPDGSPISKMQLSREWQRLRAPREEGGEALELPDRLTWYGCGRHAAVNRWLAGGASLEDTSRGVNHSDVAVTKEFYVHLERKTFPSSMRRGLGVPPPAAVET